MANLGAGNGGASLRVAFAGTPDFAVPALVRLIASPHDVRLVFTQPDRPRGRGQRVQFSPVKIVAKDHGVPVHQPAIMGADTVELMRQEAIDVLVVAAYGQIVSQAVLDAPQYGCVNIHASLLPRWRGAAPVVYALLAGDDETGVTIMQMDAGLDSGPILYQQRLNIQPAMHQVALLEALAELGAQSIDTVLAQLPRYQSQARPQEVGGVLYAPKINKNRHRSIGLEPLSRLIDMSVLFMAHQWHIPFMETRAFVLWRYVRGGKKRTRTFRPVRSLQLPLAESRLHVVMVSSL